MIFVSKHVPEDIFAKTPDNDKHKVRVQLSGYNVKLSSQRIITFKKNPCCVICGLKGDTMVLEFGNKPEGAPHLNFYAQWKREDESSSKRKSILITKDHIIPKSKGGRNVLSNYQTMCTKCNSFKGNLDISIEEQRYLMRVWHSGGTRTEKLQKMFTYLDSLNKNDEARFINGKFLYKKDRKGRYEEKVSCTVCS